VTTTSKKRLIVNADDFGQSRGVNRGIIEAHEHGIVTSASLMVRWPAAAEAVAYARGNPKLSLGIHIDLGEWAFKGGTWAPVYEVVPPDDAEAIRKEVAGQLATFRRLTGGDPSHVDSHQHVHRREPMRAVILEFAHKLAVPLRHRHDHIRYCGDFYGQTEDGSAIAGRITIDGLIQIVAGLRSGCTELACHPGFAGDLDTMYRDERAQEVKVLCDPRVRTALDNMGVELCSFADVAGAGKNGVKQKAAQF
jgi:predicted glycoside hydrolase/deacetylase ChbG (UPF0249 family)